MVCLGRTAAASNRLLCTRASQHARCLCACEPRMSKCQKKMKFSFRLWKWLQDAAFLGCNQPPPGRIWPACCSSIYWQSGSTPVALLHTYLLFLSGTFPLSCSRLALSLSPNCSFFSPLAWPICHINEKAGPLWFRLVCRCDEMERWWKRSRAVD